MQTDSREHKTATSTQIDRKIVLCRSIFTCKYRSIFIVLVFHIPSSQKNIFTYHTFTYLHNRINFFFISNLHWMIKHFPLKKNHLFHFF